MIKWRCLERSISAMLAAAAALMFVPSSEVRAALILYEPFDYSAGTLNGQNGGTGFSGAWSATGTTASAVGSPGLSYGALQTTGNMLNGIGSMWMKRTFSSSGLTGNGSTLWFSWLISATDTTPGTATAIPSFFSDVTGPHGQAAGFAVSYNITSQTSLYMDARIGGTTLASTTIPGTNYYQSGVALVLGRITFSDTANQDRLEVWLNPPLETDPGAPLFNVAGQWTDPGANNGFYMSKYDPPDRMIDELRLGTTLVDVTPTPEPAAVTLTMAGSIAYGVIVLRRRRRPPN